MKHNLRRIFAIAGVILLAGMYIATLIFALLSSAWAMSWLRASIFATFFVPFVLYAMQLFNRLRNRHSSEETEEMSASSPDETKAGHED